MIIRLRKARLQPVLRHLCPALLPVLLVLHPGCAPTSDRDADFEVAHARAKAGDWATAMTETKALLLTHPDFGPAHFLLGQCYLYGQPPNLVQAQGELRTAWEIFRRDKTFAPWEDDMTRDEYALKLHTVMAAMHMRWISEALQAGVPFDTIQRRVEDELKPHIHTGLKLDPENPFMKELKITVDRLLADGLKGQRRPSVTLPSVSRSHSGNGAGSGAVSKPRKGAFVL